MIIHYNEVIKIKKQGIAIVICLILLITITKFTNAKSNEIPIEILPLESLNEEEVLLTTETIESPQSIVVDIKGEIVFPGIYEVDESFRVHDVIELAGGLTEFAKTKTVNFAQIVRDEMVIYIPHELDESMEAPIEQGGNSKISINHATLVELQTLPGIGNVKAQAIINYREEFGSFKTLEELINVSGIGEKTLENLREFIEI